MSSEIPWSAMKQYAEHLELSDFESEEFMKTLRAMNNKFTVLRQKNNLSATAIEGAMQ